jgi:hypothetical protein
VKESMQPEFMFLVGDVTWSFGTSRALTGSAEPREPRVNGIESADFTCKECGEQFRAHYSKRGGPGRFVLVQGGLAVQCSGCRRSGLAEKPHPPMA